MSDEVLTWLPRQAEDVRLGLRERKKRQMRAQLSSAATRLFLERGFDEVRVTEIATACGVSEKTVFNYFPSKEALLLERFESTRTALRTALADPENPPLESALSVLAAELQALTDWLAQQPDPRSAVETVHRFHELIRSTAGLRAYELERVEQLTTLTTAILADRAGHSPGSPEDEICAVALTGLWRVHATSRTRWLAAGASPGQIQQGVSDDVARAAAAVRPVLEPFTSDR
ncbi:TetR family transcriptional regulator [Kineosporia sp. NBRC 101731]|uniref:TetR/AcrR family transcriptional regulator n=1 Tax=Kineosporia sp. NBRC 101731 TaxID=3032199 RepID=UPI0024A29DC0|nr:TetR family transcriptional regulator [Kineosporia sp. NBRC 101731]GLY30436.1 TetR family transcriptional regulator [Kineosporia sp. NBRC 101731]